MKGKRNGNLLILSSALLFSLGGMCIKQIPWAAPSINGVRCGIAALILFAYLLATGGKLKLSRGVFLGAFCVCGTTLLYMFANKLTTAGNAILIQFAAPVFIIFFMWFFFKEPPRRLDVIAALVVFSGIACFVMDGLAIGGSHMLGNGLALLSGVTYAGVFMVNRLPGGDVFSATILGHTASALIAIPFLTQETDFSGKIILLMLVLGVFQMGLGYLCFCVGIKNTAPVTASLISGVEPIMNPLLTAIVVGEMISPIAGLGGAIVLGAVTTYNVLVSRQMPEAEDLEAIEALEIIEAVPLSMKRSASKEGENE